MMKGNVLVLTVSRVIWSMSDTIVYPYLSLFILALGGSKNTIGDVYFWGSLAACILYPIGGYIADKAGRAKFVGLATLLYVTSFLIFASAPSWGWLAVAYAYQQIVLFYMPALNAIMADSIPVGGRGRIYAFTIAIPEAVRIMTPYLGGYLIAVYTLDPAMRIGYTMSFLIGIVVAFIRLRYLKETIQTNEGIGKDIPKIFVEGYRNVFDSLRWVFSNIRGYAITTMLLSLVGNLVLPFWVVYATEVTKLTAYDWGLVLLIGGITKTIASLYIGSLVDRIGSRKCMLMGFTIAIPTMTLFTYMTSFWVVVPVYMALILASSLMWISSSVYLANTIPRATRGRIMSALGSGMSIGVSGGGYASGFLVFIPMAIGSKLGGLIYTYNPAYPWFLQSIFLVLGMACCFLYIKDPEKAEH
jgi:DHA1 family multidrug resistance protein-like MFS transporter